MREKGSWGKIEPMQYDYITKIEEERAYESKKEDGLKAGSLITRCLADIPAKPKDKQFKIEDIPSIWNLPMDAPMLRTYKMYPDMKKRRGLK